MAVGRRGKLAIAGCSCCCCFVAVALTTTVLVCKNIPATSQVTTEVADELLGGKFSFEAKDMPAWPAPFRVAKAVQALDAFPWKDVPEAADSTLSWGSADAKTVAGLMYNVTKVNTIWDKVPEKLRGVFWMKGNAIPEELVVLQYGLWSESQLHHIVPMAPFMWSWPLGKPTDAGVLYTPSITFQSATQLVRGQKADTCCGCSSCYDYYVKHNEECRGRGAVYSSANDATCGLGDCSACEGDATRPSTLSFAWTSRELLHAQLQVFDGNDLTRDVVNAGALHDQGPAWATGNFALEAESGDGSQWKRGIKWGIGKCATMGVEFGSYTLVKIIDGDGLPVQPHHDDFLAFMGDVPLIVWTGGDGGFPLPPK